MFKNNQPGKLQSAGSIKFRMPSEVFTRLGGKATREEVMWTCDECGPIEPSECMNGWLPSKCPCQKAEQERLRKQQDRMEVWKLQQEALARKCQRCYSWLGPQWSDPALSHKTFGNFDDTLQEDAFFGTFEFAEQVASGEQPGNLVMYSSTYGTGKTHLAAAVCNSLISKNTPCLFATGQNIFNAFGARFDNHQGADDLIAMAGNTPLLVIDDLDKTHASGYKQGIFFNILNQRNLKKLPTIITTNSEVQVLPFDIPGLTEYIGGAACSRLKEHGLKVICMAGSDYRNRGIAV